MAGISLGSDEVVLSVLNKVQDGNRISAQFFNVTLTNKRIIVCKWGLLGKEKFLYDKPLSDVKVFDGTAQVKVTTISGTMTKIDVFLVSGSLSFKLSGAGNTDAIQFANALNRGVTGEDADIYSMTGNDTGADAFKKAFWGINSIEAKRMNNQKVAIRCTGCGGSFEGIKGRTARCPYCGTYYNA